MIELATSGFIHGFEIIKDPVEVWQRFFIIFPGNISAGFDRSMDESFIAAFKEIAGKFRLREWFAAGEGDTASCTPVLTVAPDPCIKVIYRNFIASDAERSRTARPGTIMGFTFCTERAVET